MLKRAEIDELLRQLEERIPAMAADRATFHEQFNEAYFAIAEQTPGRGHRYLEDRAAEMLERLGLGAREPG